MKKSLLISFLLILGLLSTVAKGANVTVQISGLEKGDKATLIVASNEYLNTMTVTEEGTFVFNNVPEGRHGVKVEANGYNLPASQVVEVDKNGNVYPPVALKIAVTKMSDDPNNWNFEWHEDQSTSGYVKSSNVNKPAEIEILGKKTVPSDVPSFGILQNNYNIVLSDDEEEWSQEYAYRLVETLKTIPAGISKTSIFYLTEDHLADDISINETGEGYEVRISKDAFYYANPFLVNLDGVKGALFSKRLHHAMVNFITDYGKNTELIDGILFERFGCRILGIDYESLTAGITNEDSGRFRMFDPWELVEIINMFEEMPEGFHKIPHLNYLIRRINGHKHPIYPESAAVAWSTENGYIEFMDKAFGGGDNNFETMRLILHEKTHFLWSYTFSDEIKNEWIEIGGWYQDPNSVDGWSTSKDTEFVSAYAHAHNPNEDMAESVAFYIKDPEKLRARSTAKFDFIKDKIMHGTRYIASIPDHLTFDVYNLWPDYDYPGKINGVAININGAPEEDKELIIEISLNHEEGVQDDASSAFVRLTSPVFYDEAGNELSQLLDIWMYPDSENPYILRGAAQVNKYSKAGYWTPSDLRVQDLSGNERFGGKNDCVISVYINNPLEDLVPPAYVKNSLEYELTDIEVEGHHCQNLKVTYQCTDNVGIRSVFARLNADSPAFKSSLTDLYGSYDEETKTAELNFLVKDFYPSTDYYVTFITIADYAGTDKSIAFSDSPLDEPVKKIHINTTNPDTQHPELDLNRMYVYAEPTHPEAPNGETKVYINFYARDDISGLYMCAYTFLDPQGNFYDGTSFLTTTGQFFEGDPTAWKHYQTEYLLPPGSVPGKWGLSTMYVCDLAGNEYTYNFVETLIFQPVDSDDGWDLFADLDDDYNLTFGFNSNLSSGDHFGFRIINETTGEEINGDFYNTRSILGQHTVNISELGKGSIVLILTAYDNAGEVLSVKSTKFNLEGEVMAEEILLNYESVSLNIGESVQLEAIVSPEETTDKTIFWESSNETVAMVSDNGLVTALTSGTAIITATCGEASATCEITVIEEAGIDSLFANPNSEISVYSPDGFLIIKKGNVESLKSLPKGIYIIVSGKDRYKISI